MQFDSDYTMTIDGRPVTTTSTIDVINPATEQVIGAVPDCSREMLDETVAAARRAFPGWRATPIEERRVIWKKVAAAITQHADELARLLTAEQGKPLADARGEMDGVAYWCEAVTTIDLPEIVNEDTAERRSVTRRVPLGVVAAIVPWNFPAAMAMFKVAPAVLAGNTVILKPSPFTPLVALKLGEIMRDILPAGVVNVVSGGDQLGPWISEHPDINKITFTGSTATGKRVMAGAAGNLKRLTLELGGNDAAIVLPDVDIDAVVEPLFWSAFGNNGQVCVATKRLYVHDSIYDKLRDALVTYARSVQTGDGSQQGTQIGPIQNRQQFERVKGLLADARAQDLDFALGGDVAEGTGYFVPVAIVDNPPEDSRVVQEEAFGPILPMLRYTDIQDVIARANASPFGLAGSIWTGNPEAALAIAEQLETGSVWINESQYVTPFATFGGHKQSGLGSEGGVEGMMEFTNPQTLVLKRRPAPVD